MARRASSCLAMLNRQLQQLEMDRALLKRELMDKVDLEFDKLRGLTLKLMAKVQTEGIIVSRNRPLLKQQQSARIDDQAQANINVPSTSSLRGRKRKSTSSQSTSAPVPVPPKRSRISESICIYPGCGKAFSRDVHLAKHERTHTGVRPFSCTWPDCHYDNSERGNVVTHIRGVHLKLPRNQKDQVALNITDRRDPKRWVRVNQQLARKRLTQADIPSLMNKSSAKVDKRRKQTKNTKSDHIYKYVCSFRGCGESFKKNTNRLNHERSIHLKAKPYGCTWPDCGHVASRRGHVINHVRTVHFGLPQTVKLQRQMSITDDRDPTEWVSVNEDEANRRVIEGYFS